MKTSFLKKVIGAVAFIAALSFVGCAGYGGSSGGGDTPARSFDSITYSAADLGFTPGSVTSNNPDVASGEIKDGKVVITPKSSGTADLTVTEATSADLAFDGAPRTAVIRVVVPTSGTPISSIVGADGEIKVDGVVFNGTFEEAIASIGSSGTHEITLGAGTYECNNVHYKGGATLKIKGLTAEKYGADVILAGKGDNTTASSEKNRSTFEFEGTGSLILENVTIKNTFLRKDAPSKNTQNEALGFDGVFCAAYNCGFYAYQDTVRTIGKAWFYGCYIEGDVDFIWMEKSGKVALYENCEIKSVYDTSDGKKPSAYILAPGMTAADEFYKGLVIYNSSVEATVSTDLFRNPWGSSATLYNIGAFVNIDLKGASNITSDVQKSSASNFDKDENGAIGWKVDKDLGDKFPSKSSEIHVISNELKAAEYNGRNRILNRVYNLTKKKYVNAPELWDINKVISDNGWKVSADTSKLDEDLTVNGANGVYNFASKAVETTDNTAGSSSDTYVSWDANWKYKDSTYGLVSTNNDATIKVQVAGASVIGWSGYEKSTAKLTVTNSTGTKILDGVTAKTVKGGYSSFLYKGEADTLTLTFDAKSQAYVAGIKVSVLDGETDSITSVAVEGSASVALSSGTSTYTANVVAPFVSTDTSVTWSVTNGTGEATINASSGVLTLSKAGTVTVKATSVFDPTKSGTKEVTITETESWPEAGQSYTYNLEDAAYTSLTGESADSFFKYNAAATQNHGIQFTTGKTMSIKVAGNCSIALTCCQFANAGKVTVVDSNGTEVAKDIVVSNRASDGGAVNCTAAKTITYTGPRTVLTFTFTNTAYIHKIVASN